MLQVPSSAAVARASSAPNLHSAAAAAAAVALPPGQSLTSASIPASQGFVALPSGGLQLQFSGLSDGFFGQLPGSAAGSGLPPPAPMQAMQPMHLMPQGSSQPLLVRVGSETHLIPHQQQQQQQQQRQRQGLGMQDTRGSGGGGSSTLGKRMNRIQSEPAFACEQGGRILCH
jgi:hypothetical protein